MRRLEIPPGDIDIVVLSHGHWDHTTGMDGLVKQLGRPPGSPTRFIQDSVGSRFSFTA